MKCGMIWMGRVSSDSGEDEAIANTLEMEAKAVMLALSKRKQEGSLAVSRNR